MYLLIILAFIFVAVISSIVTRAYIKTSVVGNLVFKDDDESGQPYIFLELFRGRMKDVKPGITVTLNVTEE